MGSYNKRPKRRIKFPVHLYCEGDQEKYYFRRIKEIIFSQPQENILYEFDLHEEYSGGGGPTAVVNQAKGLYKTLEAYIVFDHDNKTESFERAIDSCCEKKYNLGYSNLNFDYWLILHKIEKSQISFRTAFHNDDYINQLRSVYGLSPHEDIKNQAVIKRIMDSISIEDVKRAIENAKYIKLKNETERSHTKHITSRGYEFYDNPDFSIHELVESIFKNILNEF